MNHFPLSEQQCYSDRAVMKRLSLISSTARRVSGVITVLNSSSTDWRNINAVTVLSSPLWCWSAVGLPGCWQVVARVFLWFSVLLCGWQGVVMVTRVLLCICQGVVMFARVLLCGCQSISMVNRVLLLLPECIFAFLCVAMWLPGCFYGYQGVVCSCQGVSTVNRVLLLLPGCFYGFLCVAMWLPGHCCAVYRVFYCYQGVSKRFLCVNMDTSWQRCFYVVFRVLLYVCQGVVMVTRVLPACC